jgi:hypothetical protein
MDGHPRADPWNKFHRAGCVSALSDTIYFGSYPTLFERYLLAGLVARQALGLHSRPLVYRCEEE